MTLVSGLLGSTAVMAQAVPEPAPASVDAAPVASGDIVVTARRRQETLVNVPISITAFSAQQIQEKGLNSVASVAQQTPGLQFDQGPSAADIRPSLRGIALIEGRSDVAIIVDGIDVTGVSLNSLLGGGGAQTAASLMDLERIEVVKGPQTVYFGRSAFAGAIQFISRDPSFNLGAKVDAALGDRGRREITAHITGPVIGDTVAATISATYRNFDGYYVNPGNGQHLGGTETAGVGGSVLVKTGDYTAKLHLNYIHEHDQPPAGYVAPRTNTTLLGVTYVDQKFFDPSQVAISSNIDYLGNVSDTYRAVLNQSLNLGGGFALDSITGLNKIDSTIQFDFDTKPANVPVTVAAGGGTFNCIALVCVGISEFDTHMRQISQDLRLSYTSPKLRAMVGGYFFDERYGEVDYSRFVGSQSTIGATRANVLGRPATLDTDTYALFGSVDYTLTDKLTLTGELRYSHEVIDSTAATGYNFLLGTGSNAITFVGHKAFNSVLPRFNVKYDVSDSANVYASAAKGSKPGGFNTGQVRDDLRPFKQETIWTYEVGTKGHLFDRRVSFEAALYYSDWSNVQVTTICFGNASALGPEPQCPDATAVSLNYIINAKKAVAKGAEINLSAKATDKLTLGFNYAYADSRFKDFEARDVFPAASSQALRQFGGNLMPLIPKHSMSGSIRYEQPVDKVTVFGEFDGRYRTSRFARFDNRVLIADKAVFDVQFGVRGKDWSLLAFVDNIMNDLTPEFTRYYGNFNPSTRNGEYISAPAKRAFGARASKSF
ncbi:TonB-dependent receptor [Polymorphobacter sp. PAMC 29334]|uniref:TonB-dependent receptor n=1 Tax=Polymorphobacter sp. PAMC 29334 TaxID=2862331 RepID=UPI001C7674EB|nr:TonB-dependent receptor [Polymorphobacter sp. PAMC 29334]QYE33948.1 TonB-dependent receptor [Polymorphobacter sp. PAMC 29334]